MNADGSRAFMSVAEPMHYWVGAGGTVLAGDTWGDPNGPLVILQHGGGQTRHAWKRAGESLGARGYHAVAFDARGHGDSEWDAEGDYSHDVMVKDLMCVVTAIGQQRPVLVGASMGGGTSLVAVGESHLDASALVLVDMAPHLDPVGVAKVQAFMNQRPEGFASLDEVADAISAYQPHRRRPTNLDGLTKNVRKGSDGRYRWHWDPKFQSAHLDFEQRQARLESCARRLTLPTLLVRGALSDVLTEQAAARFLKLCGSAECVNVAGAAHMVAGDRNDIFTNAVMSFLTRIAPLEGAPSVPPEDDAGG